MTKEQISHILDNWCKKQTKSKDYELLSDILVNEEIIYGAVLCRKHKNKIKLLERMLEEAKFNDGSEFMLNRFEKGIEDFVCQKYFLGERYFKLRYEDIVSILFDYGYDLFPETQSINANLFGIDYNNQQFKIVLILEE